MRKAWYPIAFSSDIKSTEPYGISLLGDPLVLYRNSQSVIQCLSDRCPHRSAPLSLGLIKEGQLECLYHGWRFGDGGQCTHIPSISTQPTKANSCSPVYPVLERLGFVWVWPIPGDPEATEDRLPLAFLQELTDPNYSCSIVRRDLNIDHGLLVENLTDPAHIPFTHKGTIGRSALTGNLVNMEVKYDSTNREEEEGDDDKRPPFIPKNVAAIFAETTYPQGGGGWNWTLPMAFLAPCFTRLKGPVGKDKHLVQVHLNVPITKTKCRLFFVLCYSGFSFLQRVLPRVHDSFIQRIVDEDVKLLIGQQLNLWKGADPWRSTVGADKIGVRYRKWRRKQEQEGHVWFKAFDATEIEDLVSPSRRKGQVVDSFYDEYPVLDFGGKDFHPLDKRPPLLPSPPSWLLTTTISVCFTLAVQWCWRNRLLLTTSFNSHHSFNEFK